MKKLDKYLIGTIVYFVTFVTANEIIFCIKGAIPDTLVTVGLSGGIAELLFGALIKISEEKRNDKRGDLHSSASDDVCCEFYDDRMLEETDR